MANFCTHCGTSVPEGSNFCTACGATVGGAAAPVAVPPQPVGVATKSPSALKIILIVIAVFVGIGILSVAGIMFGVWRVARTVKVTPGHTTILSPLGSISMGTPNVSEADLGAPLYPNAKREENGVNITTNQGSMATYIFKTTDSPAQVMAFYRDKFGPDTSVVETPQGGMITAKKSDKEGVMITVASGDDGKTSITIIRGRSQKTP